MAVVLAAGKGTRMESELPKVLVPVAGRPMLRYVIDALRAAGVGRIVVVVGYREDLVREELAGEPGVEFAVQTEQLGTGHAVISAREAIQTARGPVLVVAGDSPMLQASSLKKLLDAFDGDACLLGTVEKEDPTGFGRIVRSESGEFTGIVEHKDATPEQLQIKEVNVSTYVFAPQQLLGSLAKLTDNNAQREYYVTDCPAILLGEGKPVRALKVLEPCEALSINNREELAEVEAELAKQQA